MAHFDFVSGDGTRLRGWRSRDDTGGVPVVISNGLGTPPTAWPALVHADSGFRAVTWYYRGTGGSDRPADETAIRVEDHMADLLALMDHEGIDQALLVCWSLGVNIAFEFAERYPHRVAGLLAVAGVPGGTFHAMGGLLRVPRRLRHPLFVAGAKVLSAAGGGLSKAAQKIPLNWMTVTVINHSGLMLPAARPEVVIPALEEFRRHDFRWYFRLAVAGAEHEPMDLEFVACPTIIVAGKWDVITGRRDLERAAARIPHAQLHVLPGSHFLPLEYPNELADLLHELAARASVPTSGAIKDRVGMEPDVAPMRRPRRTTRQPPG
jgi:pimeloyl-ACP methyl ester carboxylesterase